MNDKNNAIHVFAAVALFINSPMRCVFSCPYRIPTSAVIAYVKPIAKIITSVNILLTKAAAANSYVL